MKRKIEDIPPVERRLILVATDKKAEEIAAGIRERQEKWSKLGWAVLKSLPIVGPILFVDQVLRSTFSSGYLSQTLLKEHSASEQITSDPTTQNDPLVDLVPIPRVDPTQALEAFSFDVGEPTDGTAYLLHPARNRHYILPALANQRLVRDKFNAFVSVAGLLGAKTLTLSAVEIRKTKVSAGGKAPVKQIAADLGISAAFDNDGSVSRQVYRTYEQPLANPTYPESFKHWIETDEDLRALVRDRIESRLSKTGMVFRSSEITDVGTKVVAELKALNIGAGINYRAVVESAWFFEVEFWPYL